MTNWKAYWASPAGRAKRMKAKAKSGKYTKKFRTPMQRESDAYYEAIRDWNR